MCFTRVFSLGLLAILLASLPAYAADSAPRNFGTAGCFPKFSCSDLDEGQLATIASDCTAQGFGIPAANVFDGVSLDGSNCMTGTFSSSGNGKQGASQCCVIADGSNCSMRCQLLMMN